MLTELMVGNFKAFGEPQRLELRRVNAVFGPNSAGKSSFIHALLLAQSAFRTGNFDVRRISTDVDLGGFRVFVHDQDVRRDVLLSLRVNPRKHKANGGIQSVRVILEFGMRFGQVQPKRLAYFVDDNFVLELRSGDDENLNVGRVAMTSQFLRAITDRFAERVVSELGEEILELRERLAVFIEESLEGTTLVESRYFFADSFRAAQERTANAAHAPKPMRRRDPWVEPQIPALERVQETLAVLQIIRSRSALQNLLGSYLDEVYAVLDRPEAKEYLQRLEKGPYPRKGEARPHWWEELFDQVGNSGQRIAAASSILNGARRLRRQLQEIAIALQSYITEDLDSIVHIGPLRWYPGKIIEGEPVSAHHESTTGETAWLRLVEDDQLRDRVNSALKQLGMQYAVAVRALYDESTVLTLLDAPDRRSSGERLRRTEPSRKELLLTDTRSGLHVRHRDVGVGVSQVLPAVVSILASQPQHITSIEQPELHLHPRLQTELADVFVEAANSGRTIFLETHSEHLLLRLLRRIRETSEARSVRPELRFKNSQLQVVYAEPTPQGTILKTLEITSQGEFEEFWPEGFFADRSEELY